VGKRGKVGFAMTRLKDGQANLMLAGLSRGCACVCVWRKALADRHPVLRRLKEGIDTAERMLVPPKGGGSSRRY
jgi:hypothetical protein